MILKEINSSKNIIKSVVIIALLISIAIFTTAYIKADNIKGGSAKEIQISMKMDTLQVKQQLVINNLKGIAVEAEQERAQEAKRVELVSYARQFLGNPYVLGGRSLTDGCDCATFVSLVYRKFGYNWSFGPVSTVLKNCGGKEVSVGDLKPGDIIFFGDLSHVAIYSGNGKIIHAMDEYNGIAESNLFINGTNSTYSGKSIHSIRRVLG